MDVMGTSELTTAPVSRYNASSSAHQNGATSDKRCAQSLKQRKSILKFRRSKKSFKMARIDTENENVVYQDENQYTSGNPLTALINSTETAQYERSMG